MELSSKISCKHQEREKEIEEQTILDTVGLLLNSGSSAPVEEE
jgi:hypothetical protein